MALSRGHGGVRVLGALVVLATACSVDLAPLDNSTGGSKAKGGHGGFGNAGGKGGSAPDASSGGTTPAGGSSGVAGSSGVGGSPTICDQFCQNVIKAGCSADTMLNCTTGCAKDLTLFPLCDSFIHAYLLCGATGGTFTCDASHYAELQNCTNEWNSYWDCTWTFTPTCSGSVQSAGGCYDIPGAECNPVTNSGCTGGDICGFDTQSNAVHCYSVNANAGECGACVYSSANGPFCGVGSECVGTSNATVFTECARFCCKDADCGGVPGSCINVGYYSNMAFCGHF